MRNRPHLAKALFAALLCANAAASSDQFTPLVASALTTNLWPFLGTDGQIHLVYELVVTNANPTPATLERIEIVDASDVSKTLAVFSGDTLLSHLRTTGASAAANPMIEFNGTRIFLVDFTLDPATPIPARLLHQIELLGAP